MFYPNVQEFIQLFNDGCSTINTKYSFSEMDDIIKSLLQNVPDGDMCKVLLFEIEYKNTDISELMLNIATKTNNGNFIVMGHLMRRFKIEDIRDMIKNLQEVGVLNEEIVEFLEEFNYNKDALTTMLTIILSKITSDFFEFFDDERVGLLNKFVNQYFD